MPSNTSHRRFQAYNVGLAKTGTNSIATLFGRYRSAHEFMFRETVAQIASWQEGLVSQESFKAYILERDRRGFLEMDSASFNHHYLQILSSTFPEAKFIFTIRDCYSWLNSILNMSLRYATNIPDWMLRYSKFFIGYEIERATVGNIPATQQKLPEMVESLLLYWSTYNQRVLDFLPVERCLIVKTNQISDTLETIADFIGIPPESLVVSDGHMNRAPESLQWLQFLDQVWLEERSNFHCGTLMKQMFPNWSPTP
ncbi:MAG: sulfotransferase [Moorea sp. SIO4E2]|uniref:sulfotransferase n=1 Tax=Moorena sp. SIO4E2 TaxID=2607826 RepID=UPI0013BE2B1E|nr:sulfotransferase [Moorena sp. SIO4E2]NEQ07045.1 sulfotransferase [Moorena sp. SIO4E2]